MIRSSFRATRRTRATRSTRGSSLVSLTALVGLLAAGCSSDDDAGIDVPGLGDPAAVPSSASPTATPTTVAASAPSPAPTPTTPPSTPPPQTSPDVTTTAAPTTLPPTTAASTTIPAPDGPYYRAGDEGPEIAVIQLKLQTAGFLDPGYTEGLFDSATNQAVLEFQGQYGLIVDGVVGPETDRALTAAALSVNADGG